MDEETTAAPASEEQIEEVETKEEPEQDDRLTKAEELAKNQKIRAEKAEKELKALKAKKPEVSSDLSSKDVLFLAKADVHEEDLDEVLDYAKFKGISVSEAHKSMKPLLDVRAEERRTAAATQTKGGARGASKVSGEDLLARAEKTGDVPETTEGMQALFIARRAARFKK